MNEFARKLSNCCASSNSAELKKQSVVKVSKSPSIKKQPIEKIADDFVFVYRKYNKYKVCGLEEATRSQEKLKDKGFEHIATIAAHIWMEKLLNQPSDKSMILMIEDLRNE